MCAYFEAGAGVDESRRAPPSGAVSESRPENRLGEDQSETARAVRRLCAQERNFYSRLQQYQVHDTASSLASFDLAASLPYISSNEPELR